MHRKGSAPEDEFAQEDNEIVIRVVVVGGGREEDGDSKIRCQIVRGLQEANQPQPYTKKRRSIKSNFDLCRLPRPTDFSPPFPLRLRPLKNHRPLPVVGSRRCP